MGNTINYAFISYKHKQSDGSFANDAYWAEAIKKKLQNWTIPILDPEIAKINQGKKISPIIRDIDCFVSGKRVNRTIYDAICESKKQVLIVSKDMIIDQESKRANNENAFIYDEIEYFIERGNPEESIITVYIDNDIYSPETCQPSILPIDKLAVDVNNYKNKPNQVEYVAGAIAAAIFDRRNVEDFVSYQRDVENRQRQQKIIWGSIALFVIVTLILFLWRQNGISNTIDAFRSIEYSKNALEQNDRQAAIIYALEAYDKAPNLPETELCLRQFAYDDYSIQWANLNVLSAVVSENKKELFILNNDKVLIFSTSDMSVIKQVPCEYMGVQSNMSVSSDAQKICIIGLKGIIIYDRGTTECIYRSEHEAIMTCIPDSFFDDSGRYLLFHSSGYSAYWDFGIIDLQEGTKELINNTSFYKSYEKDLYNDDLYYPTYDSLGRRSYVYNIKSKETREEDNFYVVRYKESVKKVTFANDTLRIYDDTNIVFQKDVQKGFRFTDVKFNNSGDSIMWLENKTMHLFCYSQFSLHKNAEKSSNEYYQQYQIDYPCKFVEFGNDDDIVFFGENQITVMRFDEIKKKNKTKDTRIIPLSFNVNNIHWRCIPSVANSLIILTTGVPGCQKLHIYNYPYKKTGKNALKNNVITHNGYVIGELEADPNNSRFVSLQCWDYCQDSLIWNLNKANGKTIYDKSTPQHIIITKDTTVYDISRRIGRVYDCGYKVLDISDGTVKYESIAKFKKSIVDDIIIEEEELNSYIVDISSGNRVKVETLDEFKYLSRYDYNVDNNILLLADTKHIHVLAISPLQELYKISFTNYKFPLFLTLSPNGNYFVFGQIFKKEDGNHQTHCIVGDLDERRQIDSLTISGFYNNIRLTNRDMYLTGFYDLLNYDIKSRNYVQCFQVLPAFAESFYSGPDNKVIFNSQDGRSFEIKSRFFGPSVLKPYVSKSFSRKTFGNERDYLTHLFKSQSVLNSRSSYWIDDINEHLMLVSRYKPHSSIGQQEKEQVVIPVESIDVLAVRLESQVKNRGLSDVEKNNFQN